MKQLLPLIALVVLVGGGCSTTAPSHPTQNSTSTTPLSQGSTSTSMQLEKQDLIRVQNLPDGSVISRPVTIKGEARGNWYFEASFPIELRDASGTLLALTPAQAQGDWMTTNFVPFNATLNYPTPTTTNGFLILRKDNPSGEPQFDNQLVIPVMF